MTPREELIVLPIGTKVQVNGNTAEITSILVRRNDVRYYLQWWTGRDTRKEEAFYREEFVVLSQQPTTETIGFKADG